MEAGIERFSSLKIVLATQMKIASESGINLRFQEYLRAAQDHEKMVFLQLLPQVHQLQNEFVNQLLYSWTEEPNYLIRGIAVRTLFQLQSMQSYEWVQEKIFTERSEFVQFCLIIGLRKFNLDTAVFSSLIDRVYRPNLQSAFNNLLLHKFQNQSKPADDVLQSVAGIATQADSEAQVELLNIYLINLAPQWFEVYGFLDSTFRRAIIQILLSKFISHSPQHSEQLVEESNNSPYRGELLRVFVAIGMASNEDLEDQIKLRRAEFATRWIECDRSDYHHLSDYAGYECKLVSCPDGSRFSIEYITVNRIRESGAFSSVDQWWEYLAQLELANLVHIHEKGYWDDDRIYCVYKIPDGLGTLYEAIQNQRPLDALQLILSVTKAMEITQNAGFLFNGVVPQNIVVTANNVCKFINLGFGLRSPNHNCADSRCRHFQQRPEVGPTTGQYVLGMTALEVLEQRCPMEVLRRVSSDIDRDENLPDILVKHHLEPHLRSVLARLLQVNAEHRYTTITPLLDDLSHIERYRNERRTLEGILSEVELQKLLLVDYIIFRYKVARRKPSFDKGTTFDKAAIIVESLARDIRYLDHILSGLWRNIISQISYRELHFRILTWYKLSPQTRHLLEVAFSWSLLRQSVGQRVSLEDHPIEGSLLLYAIYSELQATTQSVLIRNQVLNNLVELDWIDNTEISTQKKISFHWNKDQDPLRTNYSPSTAQESQLVLRFFRDKSLPFTKPLTSISALAFLIIVNSYGLKSYSVQSDEVILYLNGAKKIKYLNLYAITQGIEKIESSLTSVFSSSDASAYVHPFEQYQNEIPPLFQTLRFLAASSRQHAELTFYDLATNQGFLARRKLWVIPFESEFTTPKVHSIGELRKLSKRRQVQIDVVRVDKKEIIATILSKPSLFDIILPVQTNFFAKCIYFIRKHSATFAIGIPIFFVLLTVFASVATNSGNASFRVLLLSICLTPASEILLGILLSTLLPEQSRDIDK